MMYRSIKTSINLSNMFHTKSQNVHFDGYKLGYIPRTANEQFCALMDQGYSDMFEARIQRITPDSHMEHQVGVIVYLKKA